MVKPRRDDNRALIGEYQTFFDSSDLRVVELTASVIERATLLWAKYAANA